LISNFEVRKERIKQRLDPDKPLDGEDEMAKEWAGREHSSPAPEAFESRLAIVWKQTGCAADGAPHVARELSRRLRTASDLAREVPAGSWSPFYSSFGRDSPEVPTLAAAFLDNDCAGARGLSEAEIARLKEIAAKAPPAPKQ
jgi:hypothetical protein